MGTPLTYSPFSQPRLGGPYGTTGQGTSASNGGPVAVPGNGPGAHNHSISCSFGSFTSFVSGVHPGTFGYEPAKHEGIRVGEIEAWRSWRIRGGYLTALTAELIWAPNESVSGDIREHGIHAFKTASEAMTYVKDWGGGPFVVGRVALWGEVVEHESGYRAEHARPMSLEFVVEGKIPDKVMAEIRKTYGFENKEAA